MRFPRVVAAHRLQTWLLVTALVAIAVAAVLIFDLARNLRTVIISEANRALTSAVKELVQAGRTGDGQRVRESADQELRLISYGVLRSYPDIEGGYLWKEDVIGHSFPTYTEPGSTLRQPLLEREEVLSALEESRRTGNVAT